MTSTTTNEHSYPIAPKTYRRVLGTLHPSCLLPDDDFTAGDLLELREQDPRRRVDTGSALFVTVLRVDRSKALELEQGTCLAWIAVNTIRQV